MAAPRPRKAAAKTSAAGERRAFIWVALREGNSGLASARDGAQGTDQAFNRPDGREDQCWAAPCPRDRRSPHSPCAGTGGGAPQIYGQPDEIGTLSSGWCQAGEVAGLKSDGVQGPAGK